MQVLHQADEARNAYQKANEISKTPIAPVGVPSCLAIAPELPSFDANVRDGEEQKKPGGGIHECGVAHGAPPGIGPGTGSIIMRRRS